MNKMDIKSLIVGFLLASCLFLFMGNTSYIGQKYGDVLKVQLVSSGSALDVNIKDFPYDKLKVKVYK
tara:strand:+ start:396 stop:596 length:201 start_codon:yes stop_codon:yes gene_type:complete